MKNPIQMLRDWTLVKKQKEGFLAALAMTPPGACISIKDPSNPITARAIIELLKENPTQLEAMDFGFEVTLMRKVAMAQSMSGASYQQLHASHGILSADSVTALGLNDGHSLPARRFRDGVPDDVNTGSPTLAAPVKIYGPNGE